MRTLYLPTELRHKIRRDCQDRYPLEACGLLVGTGENMVTDVIPSPNRSDQPQKNFEIDPALIIRHHKRARHGTARIVGHYHSHPDGQALPSSHDQNHNYDSDLVWVIVQVTAGGAQEMKAYFTRSGQLRVIALSPS